MKSKTKLESCCGSEAYLYILLAPVLKKHVKFFEDAGYRIMSNYLKIGILQAIKQKLTITITIGQTRMNTRCYKGSCPQLFKELEIILSKIENAKS